MIARRWLVTTLAAILLPLAVGGVRAHDFLARRPMATSLQNAPNPAYVPHHDALKPTVAVLLGADITEITDALGPYEMFARAGLYNVYAVAPTRHSVELTGGLRVHPHHSLGELDALLQGRPPLIVVAPNIPHIRESQNAPIVQWVRKTARGGATMLSWCAGAAVLAEAGLLDGRTATSHWGDLARLEREYPDVTWVRGTRWVDHGGVVMSAGITSGIDATLHLLGRVANEATARRIADELHYPNYHFAVEPAAEQYRPRPADAVLLLNAAFRWPRERIGLALYDGVGELDMSAVYDAHAATAVADVLAISHDARPVLSAHGLRLEPALAFERDDAGLKALDRVIVPGAEARAAAARVTSRLLAFNGKLELEYLQVERGPRFSLEPVIEDLARTADRATATFALRRLEYRSKTVQLEGGGFPRAPLVTAFLVSGIGLLLTATMVVRRRFLARSGSRLGPRRQVGTPNAGP